MPFTGERLTLDHGGQTQIEHLHRYLLAREWCRGKDVLDVASGEGYVDPRCWLRSRAVRWELRSRLKRSGIPADPIVQISCATLSAMRVPCPARMLHSIS